MEIAIEGLKKTYRGKRRKQESREALAGVDTIFHLAGEPVAEGRWSVARKGRIRESRIAGTRNLVAARVLGLSASYRF